MIHPNFMLWWQPDRCVDYELLRRADCGITRDYLSPDNAELTLFCWVEQQCSKGGDELQYARKVVTSTLIMQWLACSHCSQRNPCMTRKNVISWLLWGAESSSFGYWCPCKSLVRATSNNTMGVSGPSQLQALPSRYIDNGTADPKEGYDLSGSSLDEWGKACLLYVTWLFDIDSENRIFLMTMMVMVMRMMMYF